MTIVPLSALTVIPELSTPELGIPEMINLLVLTLVAASIWYSCFRVGMHVHLNI